MFETDSFSLTPVHFFQMNVDCRYLDPELAFPALNVKKAIDYRLPDTSMLCAEELFADVAMGWNENGLEFLIESKESFQESSDIEITQRDSVELFIDTRDIKMSGYATRFCHHFFFLPEAVEGKVAGEITRFRTEDSHELCNPLDLQVSTRVLRKGYEMHIFIPSQCLHGYDPIQVNHLGFTYRINRYGEPSQHFSVTSSDYQIEQQPSLWASFQLIRS